MVPDNNNKITLTPKPPPPPPPSSSSSSPFQFRVFPSFMTETNPNPNPNPNPYSQPQPQPQSPPPHSDSNFNFNFPQFPFFPHDRPHSRDSDSVPQHHIQNPPRVPHWVDHQTPLPSQIVVSDDDDDVDIDSLVASFLSDVPAALDGSSSYNAVVADERGKGFLKRGTLDFLGMGIGLSINDHNNAATTKRTKTTTTTTTTTGELYNGGLDLGFDLAEADRRGKRTLDDHDAAADDGVVAEVVVLDDLNGGGDGLRRLSREEKMKGPVFEIDFLSDAFRDDAFRAPRPENPNVDIDLSDCYDDEYDAFHHHHHHHQHQHQPPQEAAGSRRRERFRDIAKENASRFARFMPDAKDDDAASSPSPPVESAVDEGPTPFSTALNLIKEKELKNKQTKSWVPKRNEQDMGTRILVPSLKELCLKILASNADAMVSLDGVPDDLRHRLSHLLCDSRRMNTHFFELLVRGSPTEIRLRDCSWLSEEQFAESFANCDPANLVVLQLDQCGRCVPDYILEQSPRWLNLTRLTSLSLSGACRLSDKGLRMLVSSVPALRSINLSQCSLLTSASINILADSLGSLLKELYLDDCQNIDAALIVSALKELEHLEVLSLAGIQTVCDKFIRDYIVARGHNMKELVLKDCIKLTDVSMKIIAEHCPGLCVLDLMNLCKLTDSSIGYLANRCQALHTLKLCRSPFSDEAIAAFVEITGESLKEFSLNNIKKVGHCTTLSLASHSKNLHTLDLSWCRNLTDNEMGLIVDSCCSLRLLKLFGCSQITEFFLNGYSNPEIQIIGLKMSSLLQHVKVPDPHQGALRYSPVSLGKFDVN